MRSQNESAGKGAIWCSFGSRCKPRMEAVHQKIFRHYSATPNTLILVLRDAVEVPVGAEENLTVGNGWRRVARLTQVIHGQKFELLRIGPKNGGDASSARDIQPPG